MYLLCIILLDLKDAAKYSMVLQIHHLYYALEVEMLRPGGRPTPRFGLSILAVMGISEMGDFCVSLSEF